MSLLDRLEKKFGGLGIPKLTVYLIAGQVILYVMIQTGQIDRGMVFLAGALVLQGEWWRLISFLLDPPVANPFFAFFAWYIFYLMGSALESQWGAFRYTVYLLMAYVLTIGVAFLLPMTILTNSYIGISVFLAFAYLYPEFTLMLFFILPVKMRWLSVIIWLSLGFSLVLGDWATRLLVVASLTNFLVFFGGDVWRQLRSGQRRRAWQGQQPAQKSADEPLHRCRVCGITDITHPDMDFRYCSKCEGQYGYCSEHLRDHEHVVAAGNEKRNDG